MQVALKCQCNASDASHRASDASHRSAKLYAISNRCRRTHCVLHTSYSTLSKHDAVPLYTSSMHRSRAVQKRKRCARLACQSSGQCCSPATAPACFSRASACTALLSVQCKDLEAFLVRSRARAKLSAASVPWAFSLSQFAEPAFCAEQDHGRYRGYLHLSGGVDGLLSCVAFGGGRSGRLLLAGCSLRFRASAVPRKLSDLAAVAQVMCVC